jgi:hypothetical protein
VDRNRSTLLGTVACHQRCHNFHGRGAEILLPLSPLPRPRGVRLANLATSLLPGRLITASHRHLLTSKNLYFP